MNKTVAERGLELLTRYDLGVPEDYEEGGEGIFYGDEGLVEHVIHELAHARLLDVPLGPKLSDRISKAIPTTTAVWEEAKTWAVEWRCLQELDMRFEWGDVVEGARIQGCSADLVEKFYEDPECSRVADSVLQCLR
jgi:hypothetical protein